jgi:hypothetical protein
MQTFRLVLVAIITGGIVSDASAQCRETVNRYCADPLLFTVAVGYAKASIRDFGTVPNRDMAGFNARADLHIISFLLRNKNWKLRISDAITADATMGSMSSDTLPGTQEGTMSNNLDFGLQFLAGWQLGKFAVLGGLRRLQYSHEIGNTLMEGSTTPLVARLEIGRSKPIFVTAHTSIAGDKSNGARVDIPLFRRLNATVDYYTIKGIAEVGMISTNPPRGPATAQLLMIGVRTRELK